LPVRRGRGNGIGDPNLPSAFPPWKRSGRKFPWLQAANSLWSISNQVGHWIALRTLSAGSTSSSCRSPVRLLNCQRTKVGSSPCSRRKFRDYAQNNVQEDLVATDRCLRNYVFLQYLRPRYIVQFPQFTHLIHVNAEIRARAHQAIGIRRRESIVGDEPIHQV